MKNLSDSLTTAAKNEIDLGSKIRELEHKAIEVAMKKKDS